MTVPQDILLSLVRLATGSDSTVGLKGLSSLASNRLPAISAEEWQQVIDMAFEQGVDAISVDGYHKLLDECAGESLLETDESLEDLKFEWFGSVLQAEEDYHKKWDVARKLTDKLACEGLQTIVLKGFSLAQYYQYPAHRSSCDLDLFVLKNGLPAWEEACKVLEDDSLKISYEIYKDAEFTYDGVYVELHRFITPVRGNKSLYELEKELREELACHGNNTNGLWMPSFRFTVLFYMEHILGHLLHEQINLKQVLDWVILRNTKEYKTFKDALRHDFERFCLGKIAETTDHLADLIEGKIDVESLTPEDRKVLDEMFNHPSDSTENKSFFQRRVRFAVNIVRNGWKFRHYTDTSMPTFFITTVWAHFFRKEVTL